MKERPQEEHPDARKKKRTRHRRRRSSVLRELRNTAQCSLQGSHKPASGTTSPSQVAGDHPREKENRSPVCSQPQNRSPDGSQPLHRSPVCSQPQNCSPVRRLPLGKQLEALFGKHSPDKEDPHVGELRSTSATNGTGQTQARRSLPLRTEITTRPWYLPPLALPPPRLTRPPAYLLAVNDRRVDRPLSPSHLVVPANKLLEGIPRYVSKATQTEFEIPQEKTTSEFKIPQEKPTSDQGCQTTRVVVIRSFCGNCRK